MAAKRRPSTTKDSRRPTKNLTSRRGPRGKTGATGLTGPAGPAGPDHAQEITVLSAQVGQLVRELQVQLTRIAQIQAQMDHLASGQAAEPQNRRASDQTEH